MYFQNTTNLQSKRTFDYSVNIFDNDFCSKTINNIIYTFATIDEKHSLNNCPIK